MGISVSIKEEVNGGKKATGHEQSGNEMKPSLRGKKTGLRHDWLSTAPTSALESDALSKLRRKNAP
jgi:hypothetical protein